MSERELVQYRSLIAGDDDRVVLDPKLANATDNVFTKSYKTTLAALETHAGRYDTAAVLATKLPCESQIEAAFTERSNEPIRRDEDDAQFARRKESATTGLTMFRKAMGAEPGGARADVRFVYGIFVTKFDNKGHPVAGGPSRTRPPFEQRLDAIDKGLCSAKFLVAVNEWWKRHRSELEARRDAGEAAKDAEGRKAVLTRRFAPVRTDCSDNWRATTTKCDELPGLSDDEKTQCVAECRGAADEGMRKAFDNAVSTCSTSGPKSCELTKPAGSTISDDVVGKMVSTCKTDCATKVREDRQKAAKEQQDCMTFCRDLKNGFCAMTPQPRQAMCVERCTKVQCVKPSP